MCIRDSLREYLWEFPDGSLKDYIEEEQNDKIRWIDTSTMICDPLTKAGPQGFADRLLDVLQTSYLSLEPTVQSQLKKLRQQKLRMQKSMDKQAEADGPAEYSDDEGN